MAFNKKTSVILEQQLPDFIREEYATFTAFLKSYYEYLELTSPPVSLPFIVTNPDPTLYAVPGATVTDPSIKTYGTNRNSNTFTEGERLIQKANPDDTSEITTAATLFSFSGNATSQTAIVTDFTGPDKKFVTGYDIVGESSGIIYWPKKNVSPLPAGSSRAAFELDDYRDLDETLEEYVQYIKNELAVSLPGALHADTDRTKVLKNIRDFYRARGTENSFKLLFRILFGEDAEIYLPQTDMLRASVGEWRNFSILRTTIPTEDKITGAPVTIENLVGRQLTQKATGATAIIERAVTRNYLGVGFAEIEISHHEGADFAVGVATTDNVGDGTVIQIEVIGMLTDVDIVDGGSNYAVGDLLTISGGGSQVLVGQTKSAVGAVAKVASVNASSGAVLTVDIVEPGLFYTSVPTLDLSGPHEGDTGAARFDSGPLETIYYNDFSGYRGGNTFLAATDNRGESSNAAGLGSSAYSGNWNDWRIAIPDPAEITGNSYNNFVKIPGIKEGLKAHWAMNQYHPFNAKINSKDGTFAGTGDPTGNSYFRGPQIGDIQFLADPAQPSINNTSLAYINTTYDDPEVANTYSPDGWYGFQPLVYDESGHGHHAYVSVRSHSMQGSETVNLYSQYAFANAGVSGAGSNSLGSFSEGGMILMPHDDIRNANTQTWVCWYKPYATKAWISAVFAAFARQIVIGRDHEYWHIEANNYASSTSTVDTLQDLLLTVKGASFDNGNPVTNAKLANSAGYFPGTAAGNFAGGGAARVGRWNMLALVLDHTNLVGNVYVYNTVDGLSVANGFTIVAGQDANTIYDVTEGWEVPTAGIQERQGRAVVINQEAYSANGDSYAVESGLFGSDTHLASGYSGYDQIRYYDQALSEQQITNLFRNPEGKYDDVLTGDWSTIVGNTNFYSTTSTANIEFVSDTTANAEIAAHFGNVGSSEVDGVRLVYTKNFDYDPHSHYKLTVRAKDGSDGNASNTVFGVVGIANNGSRLLAAAGADDYDDAFPVALGVGGLPAESGSMGSDWFDYVGVFGGNTSVIGLDTTGSTTAAHGGNTTQASAGKTQYTWANPAKLYGATGTGAFHGNTTHFRPVMFFNSANQDDESYLDFVKIERAKNAELTAQIGAQFKWAGQFTGDAGKLSTSPTSEWVTKYLQDDRFYQIYSYVIKSGLSLNQYKEVIRKLAHPAGTIMFGAVNIQSEASVPIETSTFADINSLLLTFYLGAESSLLSEYADIPLQGRGVTYRAEFGLKNLPPLAYDLDLAHGVNPHGAGNNTPGSPGWIAWNESPLTSPFANSHYFGTDENEPFLPKAMHDLWPYDSNAFETSNAHTTVTKDSLIFHVDGYRTMLVSAFENANVGALSAHGAVNDITSGIFTGFGNQGWSNAVSGGHLAAPKSALSRPNYFYGFTQPLDIDGGAYRYVRMKVRRIGPGGYGSNSWMGMCQADTNPSTAGSDYHPTQFQPPSLATVKIGAANTAQPPTLVLPADSSADAKSPWHIIEWDMWTMGGILGLAPVDGSNMWKYANSSTGTSPQDGAGGRRVGSMAFHLCYEPDGGSEKFEIQWIQVDDGTGWPRGSYPIPAGYTINSSVSGSGAGSGGMVGRQRITETSDISEQLLGDLSATVTPSVPKSGEVFRTVPVLYTSSTKELRTSSPIRDVNFDSNGAIFRVSANTANNLDWIVTEVIDSGKLLRTAPGAPGGGSYLSSSFSSNGAFSGPVILDTDDNDNLYVGYVYEELASYPGLVFGTDPKPLLLFRGTPIANAQAINVKADPHNLFSVGNTSPVRGRSNTYAWEQILWGNVGGVDGVGVTIGGGSLYDEVNTGSQQIEMMGMGFAVEFGSDDLGSLYVLGSGSQNLIKILPAANASYANGLVQISSDSGTQLGRRVYELANTTTLNSNGTSLGNWLPRAMLPGPKDSIFVVCDTNYNPSSHGANSVYLYHVVPSQNTATGEFYTKNVYPVFVNTSSTSSSLVINQTVARDNQCAGLALDNNDPPNLYYMTANTIYRIKPKGYSYENGDAEIEQIIPARYLEDTLNWGNQTAPMLGHSRYATLSDTYVYQNHYIPMYVDEDNRLFFSGGSNVFCYSRGSNTSQLLYNTSNTEFSTLQVVANTTMYTSNIDWDFSSTGGSENTDRNSVFALTGGMKYASSAGEDPTSFGSGLYFGFHGGGTINPTTARNPRNLCVVYPNANGSFVSNEGGQIALTLMDEIPSAETRFVTNGSDGSNKYRGANLGKIILRPEKI